jgi:hypothetical protein
MLEVYQSTPMKLTQMDTNATALYRVKVEPFDARPYGLIKAIKAGRT